jgi:octaprenyl-diphosphate synthase
VFASGWGAEANARADLVKVAAVIEMVHLATLVHDDIMDRADSRRSRPTAARTFGPAAAVLLGDTLFAQSVHLATQFPTTEVCREVSAAARRVCSGEILQTLGRSRKQPSLETYWRVIELKTAELFRVACRLGASVAGHGPGFAAAAEEFGRRLGIAFQVFDDLADYVGSEEAIGKTLGTDFATGKLTLPLHLLQQRAPSAVEALRSGKEPVDLSVLRDLMLEHAVDTDTVAAIEAQLAAGESLLESWAHLPSVGPLLEISGHLRSLVAGLRP